MNEKTELDAPASQSVTGNSVTERNTRSAIRHAAARVRHDAADRREEWADYVGRADTAGEISAAARDREDDQCDHAQDVADAALRDDR